MRQSKIITSALVLWLGLMAVTPGLAQTPVGVNKPPVAAASSSPGAPPTTAAQTPAVTASTTDSRNLAATVAVVDPGASVVASDKAKHVPKVGDKIYEGDAISTGDGEVHLDMADGGYIAVRPNTTMKISKYQANGDADDKSVIGLLKGSLRSITGWIGHDNPRNYSVVTPTATIGVRGTDHEPAYVPEGTPGQDPGTYDNVHAGATTISNAAGKIDVTPNHAGFVDFHPNSRPRLLEHVPTFFQTVHRHDDLLAGKHEKVMAGLEQRRTERIEQHRQELRNQPGSRLGARPAAGTALRSGERPGSLAEHGAQRAGERNGGLAEHAAARPGERLNPATHPLAGRSEPTQQRATPLRDAIQHARENAASNAANRAAAQAHSSAAPLARPLARPASAAKEPPKRREPP